MIIKTTHTVSFISACLLSTLIQAQEPIQEWRVERPTIKKSVWEPSQSSLKIKLHDRAKAVWEKPHYIKLTGDGKSQGGLLITTTPDDAQLPKEHLTIEAWLRIHKPLKWGGILAASQDNGSHERGFILGYHEESFYFGLAAQNTSPQKLTYMKSTVPWQPGEWYHLVATYDGVKQRIYVDGRPAGESAIQRGPIFHAAELNYAIGAYWDKDEKYTMDGDIQSIRLWNRTLSAEEIAKRFEENKTRFPGIEPTSTTNQSTEDWPTHRHDNFRSGHSNSDLPNNPELLWTFTPTLPPNEAWPGTAQSDFWRKRSTPEKKRITFDKAFAPVSANGRVYFGSSSDDQLYCLDLKTGKHLWSFFADAPIRLAPTVAAGKVIFGADDGTVYAVGAINGKLVWKNSLPETQSSWLPGNGRIISLFPIRSSILIRDKTAYFGYGLFPKNTSAWYCSMDIRNGKIIDRKPLKKSLQGYLINRSGKIFAPTGRDPSGMFIANLKKQGKQLAAPISTTIKSYPYSFASNKKYGVGGGDGKIAMFQSSDGSQIWSASVPGIARSLAIARGHLLVSTDHGKILCYGTKTKTTNIQQTPHYTTNTLPDAPPLPTLAKVLPYTRGYALVLDAASDQGKLLLQLCRHSELKIIGLVRSESEASQLRHAFASQALYGNRVTIYKKPKKLPYRHHIFNLITSPRPNKPLLSRKSLQKLLRPSTGVIWIPGSHQALYQAPALKGTGEWTHMYANPENTACSGDTRIGTNLALQWFGRPGPQHIIDRHLRPSPPLVKNGLLVTPGNNYIICSDGWNGTVLWEKSVPDMRRIGALRDSGNLVLTQDLLYCASGTRCLALDTYTGKEKLTLNLPTSHSATTHEWGYLASIGSGLIGTAVKKGSILREMSPTAIYSGGYGDNTQITCSDVLFVLNRHTGKLFWKYHPQGSILNPSIAVSGKRICFIESQNPSTLTIAPARMHYKSLIESKGAKLICLDLISGKKLWSTPIVQHSQLQTLFVLATRDQVFVSNSRNHTAQGARSPTVHYDVRAYNISNGKQQWEQTRDHKKRPNLDHGEQDLHPAIVDNQIIAEPHIYDIKSGKEVGHFNRKGYGCGTISASALSLYFRAGNIASFDLKKKSVDHITNVNRSGCWINMIPASGLLLVPEGSSGCICNYAIQGSMGFAPTEK